MFMIRLRIAVADEDRDYLKQITNYLIKGEMKPEVFSFSRQERLIQFLSTETVDILLLSVNMRCEETDTNRSAAKILLTESSLDVVDGYITLPKYQKTTNLINSVMLEYGKFSGKGDSIAHGNRNTHFIGIYSPIGGSGKTTLSVLIAQAIAMEGLRVFYQNCEKINSLKGIMPDNAQISLSDLFVYILAGENMGLELLSKMSTPPELGFSFVNPADSSLEWNELSIDKRIRLLTVISEVSQFNYIVLDFDSELTEDKQQALLLCDHIVMPFLPGWVSLNKFKQFYGEMERGFLDIPTKKLICVGNQCDSRVQEYLKRNGDMERFQPMTFFPPSQEFADIFKIVKGSSREVSKMRPIVQRILES